MARSRITDGNGAIYLGPRPRHVDRAARGGCHQRPCHSPDGTRLASLQITNVEHTPDLVVSDADGGDFDIIVTTVKGMSEVSATWPDTGLSPPRRDQERWQAARVRHPEGAPSRLPCLEGIDAGVRATQFHLAGILLRPPAGDEILATYAGPDGDGLDPRRPLDGGAPIAVLTSAMTTVPCTPANPPPCAFGRLENASWSPDGTRIVFGLILKGEELGRAWIVNVHGTRLRRLTNLELSDPTPSLISEGHVVPRRDARRHPALDRGLRGWRCRPTTHHDRERPRRRGPRGWADNVNGYVSGCSPDGTSIVEVPNPPSDDDAGTVIIVDAETGEVTRPGWDAGSAATWQRTLPMP